MAVNSVQQVLVLLVLVTVRLPHAFCQCNSNDAFVDDGYPMSVGEKVRFVLQSVGRGYYGWLTLALCSPQSCSAAGIVDREDSNGTLVFRELTTATNAPTGYATVKRELKTTVASLSKGRNFTFVMHRTNTKSFDFWIEGERRFRMTVQTQPNQLRLKWGTNLGSIYSEPARARGDYVLSEGQDVKLKLVTAETQMWYTSLGVGLCGPSGCDKAFLYSVSEGPQPRLAYEVLRSDGHYLIGSSTLVQPRTGPAGHFPGNRSYTFVIQRRQGAVDIWLDGSPDSKITFASNNTILRVLSWVGSTYFVHEGREKVLKKFGTTCGRAIEGTEALVSNGINTSVDKMPWHAIIYMLDDTSYWKGICGGTLVAPSIVVTAAHCVAWDSGTLFPAVNLTVGLGQTLSGFDAAPGDDGIHRAKVKMIHLPDWYRGSHTSFVNDIAVLELDSCATLGNRIFPICIDESVKSDENELLKVAGWGNGGSRPLYSELQSVLLPFMSMESCKRLIADRNVQELRIVTADKFCSYRNLSDPGSPGMLKGDSGGGAVIKRNGRWYFQGVVSVITIAEHERTAVYGFTDLTHHLGWMSRLFSW